MDHKLCNCSIQLTLYKADTLGTKATVRFGEMSALEGVHVTIWYPNLQIETRAFVQSLYEPVAPLLAILTDPNTAHTNWYILLKSRDEPVIRLRYFRLFQVCSKFV